MFVIVIRNYVILHNIKYQLLSPDYSEVNKIRMKLSSHSQLLNQFFLSLSLLWETSF